MALVAHELERNGTRVQVLVAESARGEFKGDDQGLRQALLSRSTLFATAFTEKLLTYALGRGVDFHDMPVVRSVVRTAAQNDNRFSAFVLGIVNSVPFQMRKAEESRSAVETNDVALGAAPARVQSSKP